MRKKITIGGAITLALMLATVTFIMTMIYAQTAFDSRVYNIKERETMYAKLAEVDQLVRRDFYTVIDEDSLSDGIVKGYLEGLNDANAAYQTASQYKESLGATEGRTVGIGAVFAQDASGYIRITEVYNESPAQLMELEVGDLIVKVDELAVTAENYNEAVAAISGEAGTTVTLTVHHESVEKNITITRRKIDIPTVSFRTIGADQNIGYVRISDFSNSTSNEFSDALATLFNANVTGLVLDVRENASDHIESMLDVLDRLVSEGNLLSATDRTGTVEVLRTATAASVDLPTAVLINAKTSGAGELLAQCLRDFGKAKIVGVTSAGHCSMKETILLSDGSAVTLTTALYNPPVSPNFEGVGVKPDFEVKIAAELEAELFLLDEANDPQLKKAVEAAGGSVHYSEGSTVVEEYEEEEGSSEEDGGSSDDEESSESSSSSDTDS